MVSEFIPFWNPFSHCLYSDFAALKYPLCQQRGVCADTGPLDN